MIRSQVTHMAYPVDGLDAVRASNGGILGPAEGLSTEQGSGWDLSGNQLVTHVAPTVADCTAVGRVDGRVVPVPHFGVLMDSARFDEMAWLLRSSDVEFGIGIEPALRYAGEPAEQAMVVRDPADNASEFNSFRDDAMMFVS